MKREMKRGSIDLARKLCYEISGPTDEEDDMTGSGYGSIDVAEILSAEVERLRARIDSAPVAIIDAHDSLGICAKALDVLLAMARLAADGKSLTIADDWGFGTATVIDQDGSHTHVGCDSAGSDQVNFEAFVNQLHGLLVDNRGLSWVKPSNAEINCPQTDAKQE